MAASSAAGALTGYDLFKLQDTYGFPLELSVEEVYKMGFTLSKDYLTEFESALSEQRERSKTASKGMFKGASPILATKPSNIIPLAIFYSLPSRTKSIQTLPKKVAI